jgi:hypothetical protein
MAAEAVVVAGAAAGAALSAVGTAAGVAVAESVAGAFSPPPQAASEISVPAAKLRILQSRVRIVVW